MPDQNNPSIIKPRTRVKLIGLIAGAIIFLALLMIPAPDGVSTPAWRVAALTVLMIIWWVSEAIPIAATALLPLAVLPMANISSLREAATAYMSPIVILLMAGFIIAKAIEKWGLHERIALTVVDKFGAKPPALIAGFMVASAMLSMWISNTATSLMMTPIALSVSFAVLGPDARQAKFTSALLLAVAYACSIGGLATPVGSPTNLIVIGYLAEQGVQLSFADWMRFSVPVVFCLLPIAWLVLSLYGARRFHEDKSSSGDHESQVHEAVHKARLALGPMSQPELRTLMVFVVIALCWMFRSQLQGLPGLSPLNDQIIAIIGVIAFFVVPSGASEARSAPLLDWQFAERIPWGVVLLFGGGLSLAGAITKTGLATILGGYFGGLTGLPDFLVIFLIAALILSLTEFTSNVATVSATLPMIGAIAVATGYDLITLAVPVGLAASCAFMLPMATGPNAVAYAAGGVSIQRMARVGFAINIAAAFIIALLMSIFGP